MSDPSGKPCFPDILHSLPLWRGILALLLILIFSAAVSPTSPARPVISPVKQRIVFIAIHVHILLVAVLLDTDMVYAVGIWAYTIAGAVIVNTLIGKSSRFYRRLALVDRHWGTFLLSNIQPYMLLIGTLFMLKVLFSFAVDHYGEQNNGHESCPHSIRVRFHSFNLYRVSLTCAPRLSIIVE